MTKMEMEMKLKRDHCIHKPSKAPKSFSFIIKYAQNWRKDIIHSLDISQIKVEKCVGQKNIMQFYKVRTVITFKHCKASVSSFNVLL